MATPKQIRSAFEPVLRSHPDLVLHRRWLIRPPVRSAIIGLYIDRTSSPETSRMALSVMPASRFQHPYALGYEKPFTVRDAHDLPRCGDAGAGGGVVRPRIHQDMFAPDFPDLLLANFNAKVLPFLDAIQEFDAILGWLATFRAPESQVGAIELIDAWIAAMAGDFAGAAYELSSLLERMGPPPEGPAGVGRRLQADILRSLRTGNRAAIAAFLHDLELQTIAAYGLERYWQPAPFPFESG